MNTWKPETFSTVEINRRIAEESFVVPRYQRGYVWNPKKRDQFVDTLKRGLPFGTILLYHDEAKNEYQIIDGLQRCTTIKNFITNPAKYFNEYDIEDDLPNKLAELLGEISTDNVEQVKSHLLKWVRESFKTMEDVSRMQFSKYAKQFCQDFPIPPEKQFEVYGMVEELVEPTLRKFQDLCDTLCRVQVPAIVITGSDENLPEIFERINSTGTQLSKYQIFAASWTKEYSIDDAELVDMLKFNKDRYEAMEQDGIDIIDSDSVNCMQTQKLNLFEICYGLARILGKKYPCLFEIDKDPKNVSGLGFSLIAACLGMKNKEMKYLHSRYDNIVGNNNSNLFLLRVIKCVEIAQEYIGKFNRFKLNSKGSAGPLHAEFQIVSLIANIFVTRYAKFSIADADDRIIDFELSLHEVNPTWEHYAEQLEQNAWKRYCIDILNSRWKGAGDTKLDSVVFDMNYYARKTTWDDVEIFITQWFNAVKSEKREHKRVTPPQEAEKIFLAMLYLPIFTAEDQVDHSKYDVEHLATKNLLKKCLDRYNGELHLPIGSIGNLCLLPQQENRAKRDRTIYGDEKYLNRSNYTLADLEAKFTFTEQSDLDWLDDTTLDKVTFEKKYHQYIEKRFYLLLETLKKHCN